MRYLFLLILVSCNSRLDKKESKAMPENSVLDSLSMALDSLKVGLDDFSEVSDYAQGAQSTIQQLEKEKEILQSQIDNEVRIITVEKRDTSKDKLIAELRGKVFQYENEIARLKKQDTFTAVDRVENKNEPIEVEKPNEKSLVIELDGRIRTGGEIPVDRVDVYLVPYERKRVKDLMQYETSCDLYRINLLGGRQASFYNGQHFFNDIAPGKYLVKICYYYGGFMVIEKKNEQQTIAMQVSPPTQ